MELNACRDIPLPKREGQRRQGQRKKEGKKKEGKALYFSTFYQEGRD